MEWKANKFKWIPRNEIQPFNVKWVKIKSPDRTRSEIISGKRKKKERPQKKIHVPL